MKSMRIFEDSNYYIDFEEGVYYYIYMKSDDGDTMLYCADCYKDSMKILEEYAGMHGNTVGEVLDYKITEPHFQLWLAFNRILEKGMESSVWEGMEALREAIDFPEDLWNKEFLYNDAITETHTKDGIFYFLTEEVTNV